MASFSFRGANIATIPPPYSFIQHVETFSKCMQSTTFDPDISCSLRIRSALTEVLINICFSGIF